jgi:hypothetical protein
MDNFSRKILPCAIATENSMHIRRKTIEEAYNKTRRNMTEEIDTYNFLRPHYTHKGLTPDEIHEGASPCDINYMKSLNLIQNNSRPDKREITCDLC